MPFALLPGNGQQEVLRQVIEVGGGYDRALNLGLAGIVAGVVRTLLATAADDCGGSAGPRWRRDGGSSGRERCSRRGWDWQWCWSRADSDGRRGRWRRGYRRRRGRIDDANRLFRGRRMRGRRKRGGRRQAGRCTGGGWVVGSQGRASELAERKRAHNEQAGDDHQSAECGDTRRHPVAALYRRQARN